MKRNNGSPKIGKGADGPGFTYHGHKLTEFLNSLNMHEVHFAKGKKGGNENGYFLRYKLYSQYFDNSCFHQEKIILLLMKRIIVDVS